MHSAPRRLLAASAAVVVVLAGAAGCSNSSPQNESMSNTGGGGGAVAASAELLSESGQKTSKGTGRFEIKMTSLGTARGDLEAVKGDGQFDNGKKQFQMSMDLSGYASQIAGSAGLDGLGLTDQLFNEPMEIIGDGDTTYTKATFLNALLGGDGSKPWVKFSAQRETGKTPGNALSNIVPFAASAGGGAAPFLLALQGASGEVKDVGTELIDGVQTRHLTATIDPDKLKAKGIVNQFGDQKYPVDVWIDGDGAVRRMQYEIDPKVALGNAGGLGGLGDINRAFGDESSPLGEKLRITLDLMDIGEPVDIQLPPADQVAESTGIPSAPGGGGLPPIGGNRPTPSTR